MLGGSGEEQVVADDEVAGGQCVLYVSAVGVGLCDVLADDVERSQPAGDRRVEHFWDAQSGPLGQVYAP